MVNVGLGVQTTVQHPYIRAKLVKDVGYNVASALYKDAEYDKKTLAMHISVIFPDK